jgi:WASH complex subunit strumpellin
MEFLAEDNICGQHLLKLAARGSAVIAELLRLSSNIPDIFTGDNLSTDPERKKHIEILFNYQYLHDPEEHENNLSKNADLLDLDQEVQESHSEILDRLYKLFESILKYQADFAKYIDDVQNGFYIQHSLDDIFMEVAGKQLMCEALYLYGTMLLLLEERIPGAVREKIMIAAYRYRGEGLLSNIDEVCRLCRSTGYIPGQGLKRPKNHPASFFSRFAPNADYVRLVIGCLQTDDIYNMATSFPNPDHRSTRLAQQASILFTILFFAPDVLYNQYAIMREFVDKYFNDNWMISTYMGYVVDLSIEWASYPAARTALQNTITVSFVRELDLRNEVLMNKCIEELKDFLTEGVLQEDYFLDNVNSLMKCVRACNVALRWRLMHRRCQNQTYNKIIHERVSAQTLVTLLLNTSQLEFILKELLLQLLANKNSTWENCQITAANSLTELSEYFMGDKALSKVKKDEKLMNWFSGLSAQTRSLDLEEDHATSTGRRIQGLIAALEDVEQYESIDTNIQIKSFLSDVRKIFRQMIRTVNVKDEMINNLENISDFSYAWESLGGYLNVFHERIQADSSTVVLLRATFLKTASVLDVPLIRITAIDSPDAVSVAEYYSSELVEFVRLVLGVIPVSVFSIMSKIEGIQAQKMVLVPSRLEAKDLKDFAQLDVRYELSKLTHQAAMFTEGVLVMEKTLLGVIQVEPRAILEEGLRRELVQQIATAMHESVMFEEISRAVINTKMSQLASTLDGLERSIEYLQDYIGISGLKMYNEEMSRVINYNVEQEANRFLKKKIFNGHSRFQSRSIPIPQFPSISSPDPTFSSSFSSSSTSSSHVSKKLSALFSKEMSSMNFMGRIMNSLLFLTHPAICVYAPEHSSWYQCVRSGDNKKKKKNNDQPVECCGVRTFALLERSLGAVGLRGLDRLFAFSTVFELNSFIKFYESEVTKHKPFLDQVRFMNYFLFFLITAFLLLFFYFCCLQCILFFILLSFLHFLLLLLDFLFLYLTH